MKPGRMGKVSSSTADDETERREVNLARFLFVAGSGMTTLGRAVREKRGAVVAVSQLASGLREVDGMAMGEAVRSDGASSGSQV